MSSKTNYHTHTTFCDGVNTPEEMVRSAIEKKFDVLGFSGHSMNPFAEDWHIAPRDHEVYTKEIRRLEEKYKDKIEILCGFEADYIPSLCEPTFKRFAQFKPDYLIGSVHYIVNEKGFFTVDESAQGVRDGIDNLFGGNGKKAVQEYFYLQRQMIKHGDFSILGHPDLVRKRNHQLKFFNENDSWYKKEVKELVKEISKTNIIVEVNTGAITRGAMNDVYPSCYMLELLKEKNIPVTISSDCHSTDSIDGAFDRALQAIKKAGYTQKAVLIRPDSSSSKPGFKLEDL